MMPNQKSLLTLLCVVLLNSTLFSQNCHPLDASKLSDTKLLLEHTDSFSVNSIRGATWGQDASGGFTYDSRGSLYTRRALLYSDASFQSDSGFKLTIEYTTGSISDNLAHNFSFGLISDDVDLAIYSGFNPFKADNDVYSIGVNLTADNGSDARGVNFTNANERVTLHTSGLRHQFVAGEKTKIFIEVGEDGFWSLYINDAYEQSGAFPTDFDLSKNYHVAVYGQDDNGGGKSVQSIKLERQYAIGERAQSARRTWKGGGDNPDFITNDYLGVGFNSGATNSASHSTPNKLLEQIALDAAVASIVPTWGDLSLDKPIEDNTLTRLQDNVSEGFKNKVYSNSENFVGNNTDALQPFVDAWFAWCDTDPVAQAFINSQPYHTGIWNRTTQQYEDATATYPKRKYMFCYAEFVLKDYSLRYGEFIDSWIFDSAGDISGNGDNAIDGIAEEQRIYQAFTNAARAGNPKIATAYNNGRGNGDSYPFAPAVRFEDFTFGHAFGGNNDHAKQNETESSYFHLNLRYVERIELTNGYVHAGGDWTWDDQIVGHFHSKVATTGWINGANQAWEQADFNDWTLRIVRAGGSVSWDGSFYTLAGESVIRPWAYDLFKGM
ncbi:hypothetical protein OAE12_01595, partial [bacterium]|nr:hypothetical protein [bacterium]